MVDKFSPLPLYIQVENYLQNQIEKDGLKPGDPVPSENQLATLLNISRMTARQAINNLVLKGVLARKRGLGTFVNDPDPERIEMPLDKLRGFSQRSHQTGKQPVNRVLRFETLPASCEIAGLLQIAEGDKVYYMERLRCLDNDPVVLEQSYMVCALVPEMSRDILKASKYQYLISTDLKPAHADREYLAEIPSEYVAGLLKLQRNEPVLKARSLVFLEEQTPLEYSEVSYNQKRYKFTLLSDY